MGATRKSSFCGFGSFIWTWTWSLLIVLLLHNVNTQESHNFYFNSGNTQNRFVPSSLTTRHHPYQSLRNPDYYDISPRPFGGVLTPNNNNFAAGLSPSSTSSLGQHGFTRSKAIRPNSLGGFIPQSVRNNVPHQQSFLAHFNEPSALAVVAAPAPVTAVSDKPKFSGFGGSSALRGGFTPSTGRVRPNSAALNYNSDVPTSVVQQPHQQNGFRNTRNRFQPSSSAAASASATSTTEATAAPSTKRFNRFGAGRTSTTTSTTTIKSPASSSLRSTNKAANSGGFKPRRPVFISREVNEPVNSRVKPTKRPFNFTTANRAKLFKQHAAASSVAAGGAAGAAAIALRSGSNNNDNGNSSEEYDEEEFNEPNQVSVADKTTESVEKLQLQESSATTEQSEIEILTTLAAENVGPATSSESPKPNITATTPKADESSENETKAPIEQSASTESVPKNTPDYEYEYVEDDDESIETTTESIKNDEKTIAGEDGSADKFVQTDKPETVETSTKPLEESDHATNETEQQQQQEIKEVTSSTTQAAVTPKAATSTDDANQNEEDEQQEDEEGEESSTTDEYDEDDEEYGDEDEEGENEDLAGEFVEEEPTTLKSSSNTNSTTAKPIENDKDSKDQEVVSVVTTKSVVNGSTSFPAAVTPSDTTTSLEDEVVFNETKVGPAGTAADVESDDNDENQSSNNATEGYVVIASIQTSRSINGARFLPFPAIEQEETKQPRSELERKIHGQKNKSTSQKNDIDEDNEADADTDTDADADADAGVDQSNENDDAGNDTTIAGPIEPAAAPITSTATVSSTESIIDKLDRVQSELSSGLLSGKYPILSEMDTSTQSTSTTAAGGSSKFVPNIRKFQPKTTTTPKVKIHHLDDADMDDLAGLLPPGFKPRSTFKNRKQTKTTPTAPTASSSNVDKENAKKPARNSTIGRSFKNTPVAVQDLAIAGLLPKGYKAPNVTATAKQTTTSTTISKSADATEIPDIFSKLKFDEDSLAKFLPKDYKQKSSETTAKPAVTLVDDISKFLPPGYKAKTSSSSPSSTKKPIELIHDDISKFLPPGYKPPANDDDANAGGIIPLKKDDISKFLPPGFKLNETQQTDSAGLLNKFKLKDISATQGSTTLLLNSQHPASTTTTSTSTTAKAAETEIVTETTTSASNFKVVFPKGIHKRIGSQRLTTPHASQDSDTHTTPSVVIKKGPPSRATTEFTGWPTPSTTPISIEKLLEQANAATINFEDLLSSTSSSTTTTSTTTTTTTTPKPTKPGLCRSDCDLAATIKIVDGVTWKPELLDHNTVEWKTLAHEIETELNEVYSNAPQLKRWYKKVRIDSFSKGSVLVDYYVELANITQDINTLEIKKLFHEALTQSPQPMLPRKPEIENETDSEDEMSDELYMSEEDVTEEKLVKEAFIMGKYVIDPVATDFSVIPKSLTTNVEFAEEDLLIPHWAIVVIVIGVGSLVFVVIFGVTVLLNRQKRSKKTPMTLTNDMLNELKVNHMGGADNYGVDDFYNIDDAWNDTKQPIKPKRFTNSMQGSNSSNIYDSWRSTRHGGDYFYDTQNIYSSQKGDDTIKRGTGGSHSNQHQHHNHNINRSTHPFADAHQMYTYNNHAVSSRGRYPRDYDPDF